MASIGEDKTMKIYNVMNFDMINMFNLGFEPSCCCFVHDSQAPHPLIAVSSTEDGSIRIYRANLTNQNSDGIDIPLHIFEIHEHPVVAMKINIFYQTVVSIDSLGIIRYWSPENGAIASISLSNNTDLDNFTKKKALPTDIDFGRKGKIFACMGTDRIIRIFNFKTGKLFRKYNETVDFYTSEQENPLSPVKLESVDFGRRMTVEKRLEKNWEEKQASKVNVIFDQSGHFIFYSTMVGIKVLNVTKNRLVRVIGKLEDTERFLSLALYQGKVTGSALEGNLTPDAKPDPTLFALSFKSERFYLFSRDEPEQDSAEYTYNRDIFNEAPTEEMKKKYAPKQENKRLATKATIHTTKGDIFIELFPTHCPLAVENFTVHSDNGYYNGHLFHRVINKFMIQTGDPIGDGTGGVSIWGKDFKDEFHHSLNHNEPFMVSMANAGKNTNGSQFFITTVPCPHLNNKHTVFGRVVRGFDVVRAIERSKVKAVGQCQHKPVEDIKIINIDVSVPTQKNE